MIRILTTITCLLLVTGCAAGPAGPSKDSSTPEPTYTISSLSIDPKACKFEENPSFRNGLGDRAQFSYFPAITNSQYFLPSVGDLEIGLVLLDWSDKEGNNEDQSYYKEQTKKLTEWYSTMSQGKLAVNWRVSETWNRLEGSWKDYRAEDNEQGSDEARVPFEQWLLDEAVAASDSAFDFGGLDAVVFAIPTNGTVMTSGTQGFEYNNFPGSKRATLVNSQEATIGNWVISGSKFMDKKGRSPSWIHWAHELGHMFGPISHMGDPNPKNTNNFYANTLYGVGLFADQWVVTRAVEGWNAWLLGWHEDNQVLCVDATTMDDEIFALNDARSAETGAKMLVIRTGKTTGLVIESREWDESIDSPTRMGKTGYYDSFVMYQIDSSRFIGDLSLRTLANGSTDEAWDSGKWPSEAEVFTNIYFKPGDTAEFAGLSIEPLTVQKGKDFIRVAKIKN